MGFFFNETTININMHADAMASAARTRQEEKHSAF